jgi:D-3-phosphoglycerate dehydrogenase
MKIAIASCDHDTFDQEQEICAREGVELAFAYRHSFTQEEIAENCRDADAVLMQRGFFGDKTLERLPKLVALGRYGVGVDGWDVRAASARQVALFNAPDFATEAVSDHAIAMALMMLRDIPYQDHLVRTGEATFTRSRPMRLFAGLTFGVVGCGRVGMATARKATALGFKVIVNDAHIVAALSSGFPSYDIEDLLRVADVVSMHVPASAGSYHMIAQRALSLMKPSAVIVNTSRGNVVDLRFLATALQEGRVRAAALDVLEEEPMPTDVAALALDRLTLTPHMAWYTEDTYDALKRRALQNVIDYLKGRPVHDMVNPEILTGETAWPVPRLHVPPAPRR